MEPNTILAASQLPAADLSHRLAAIEQRLSRLEYRREQQRISLLSRLSEIESSLASIWRQLQDRR